MKSTIVGVLAVLAWAGCGVGLDDPEGQAAAFHSLGHTGQALTQGKPSNEPETTSGAPRGTPPGANPAGFDGTRALPQDPVPLRVGPELPPVVNPYSGLNP